MTNQDVSFTYDSRDQLIQVIRGTAGSEEVLGHYDYNAYGFRVRHRFSERGDVDYYYDDTAVLEEHNATDGSLLAHYRYADRLLSLDTGTTAQYYHHDALGSTANLTTETGSVQVSYRLDPWGHIRTQSGTSVNRHIFTQQEHDLQTGLIYFGARYYDPDTARFITQDPYLGESSTPPSLHRYLYAYSNPTVYVDLLGYFVNEKMAADLALRQGGKLAGRTASKFIPILGQMVLAAEGGYLFGYHVVGPLIDDTKMVPYQRPDDLRITSYIDTHETVILTPEGAYTSQGKKVTMGDVADWMTRRNRESLEGGGVVADSYEAYVKEKSISAERETKKFTVEASDGATEFDTTTSAKGTQIPEVKRSIEIGQEAHRQLEHQDIEEWLPEQKIELPDGTVVRKDGVSRSDPNKVRIIKPDTTTGRKSAQERSDLMKKYGYESHVDFYDPNDPLFQKGSPTYIGPRKNP